MRLLLVHLLKVLAWPDSDAVGHWRGEVLSFQADAAQRFTPSMRQKIDLERLYRLAWEQVSVASYDGRAPGALPETCPLTLDQLLTAHEPELRAAFAATG